MKCILRLIKFLIIVGTSIVTRREKKNSYTLRNVNKHNQQTITDSRGEWIHDEFRFEAFN